MSQREAVRRRFTSARSGHNGRDKESAYPWPHYIASPARAKPRPPSMVWCFMIELRIQPGCQRCKDVEEELHRATMAHEVTAVPDSAHCLVDGGEVFQGHDAMDRHVEELRSFVAKWRRYQVDACYCRKKEDDS